jgi:hypothetical protein
MPVTPRKPKLCAVCGATLDLQPKGRGKRFCGVACRMAAYRRRRQGVSEKVPRWVGPRGQLRLSRLPAFEREQMARRASEQARAERPRRQFSQPSASGTGWKRPPTAAEFDAMTDGQLRPTLLVGVGGEGSAVEAGWLRGSEGAYSGVDSGAGGQNAPPTAPLTRNPTQRPVGGRGNGHPGPQRPAQALWRAIRRPGPTSSVTPAADRVSGLALVLLLQATDVVHQLLDGLPCLGGQAGGFGVNHGVGGLRQELSSLPRYHWSQHDTRCSSRERSWAVAERWGSVSRRLVLV